MIGKNTLETSRDSVNKQYSRLSGISKTNRMSWFTKRRFGNI